MKQILLLSAVFFLTACTRTVPQPVTGESFDASAVQEAAAELINAITPDFKVKENTLLAGAGKIREDEATVTILQKGSKRGEERIIVLYLVRTHGQWAVDEVTKLN